LVEGRLTSAITKQSHYAFRVDVELATWIARDRSFRRKIPLFGSGLWCQGSRGDGRGEGALSKVSRDQYEVDGLVVKHMPTGARFSAGSDVVHWGTAGEATPKGEEYPRDEVMAMALEILRELASGMEWSGGG
jgi:hypothetical protein